MIYLDTSVLLVYTLTESLEVERAKSVRRLFVKIDSGVVSAATSFYALHEVYVFALENAPDLDTQAIVAYDEHFRAIDSVIPYRTPAYYR